jgi:hypothetical protein
MVDIEISGLKMSLILRTNRNYIKGWTTGSLFLIFQTCIFGYCKKNYIRTESSPYYYSPYYVIYQCIK